MPEDQDHLHTQHESEYADVRKTVNFGNDDVDKGEQDGIMEERNDGHTAKRKPNGQFIGSEPYADKEGGAEKPDWLEKDYDKMTDMKGKMSNADVRKWYDYHDRHIGERIDKTKTIEDQAHQAHELRNTYKFQARELMADQEKRKELDRDHPLRDFEYYYSKYEKMYDSDEEVFKAIINSSMRPNKSVNQMFGLE